MKKISFEAFYRAENASFSKNLPIKYLLKPDGGEMSITDIRKVKELYPKRAINGHKGTYGRVLIIAGSDKYTGAARLTLGAALRSGVGIAILMTTPKSAARASLAYPEAIVTELEAIDGQMTLSPENAEMISKEAEKADAIVIGCGMGNAQATGDIVEYIINTASCPIIIDADGINAIATRIDCLRNAKADILLTPHVGELSRLCGCDIGYAKSHRCELAKSLSKEYGITVMAKSASTVITSKSGEYLTAWGNDGLAKGGSGDTLAGLCGSFIAQGLSVTDGAILASSVLGLGCELISKKLPTRSVLASDITRILPMLFKKIERLD